MGLYSLSLIVAIIVGATAIPYYLLSLIVMLCKNWQELKQLKLRSILKAILGLLIILCILLIVYFLASSVRKNSIKPSFALIWLTVITCSITTSIFSYSIAIHKAKICKKKMIEEYNNLKLQGLSKELALEELKKKYCRYNRFLANCPLFRTQLEPCFLKCYEYIDNL